MAQLFLHVVASFRVSLTVGGSSRLICIALFLLGICISSARADSPSLSGVISSIERRYNGIATLIIGFEQRIEFGARPPVREVGILYLQRPLKMRWDYTKPAGKLLVADGEVIQMYNPRTNQVRHLKFSATADFRAPLSFLLGRLHFRRQFRNLRLAEEKEHAILLADGRTGEEAYRKLTFVYDPDDYRLLRLTLHGQDQSITTFEFDNEMVNTPIDATLFEFSAPADAEVLKETFTGSGR